MGNQRETPSGSQLPRTTGSKLSGCPVRTCQKMRFAPSCLLWSPGIASWAVKTTLMMGFFTPEICPASFPEGIFWTFSVLCVRGLLGVFSRSSSLYFLSSSRSDSSPTEQIILRCIKYPFVSVTELETAHNLFMG